MVLVDFRSFGATPFDLVAFLGLIRFSSLSISDKPSSLNEKHETFFNVIFINKTLEWFLFLFIPFSMELISFLSVSMMQEFSFISKPLVVFSKNLLGSLKPNGRQR